MNNSEWTRKNLTISNYELFISAPALDKRNVCAEIKGEYDIKAAKMEGRFLKKYMTVEDGHYRYVKLLPHELNSHKSIEASFFIHRIQFLHHLPGESMDIKNLRGCVELDFDIVV